MIERTFSNIPEGKVEEFDEQSYLLNYGHSSGINWETLLQSKRILIVSEAGSGKTYECKNQCEELWRAGDPSFFLELATLAQCDLRTELSVDEEDRFDQWLSSQSGVATFFLDSYDELKLSLGSFKQALNQLGKAIRGRLDRARIVITTRPIPFDEELIRRLLPVPPQTEEVVPNGENFAQIALHGTPNESSDEGGGEKRPPDWSTVSLLPFSDEQIVEFSQRQGVGDPEEMFNDLKSRNAQQFARRPQDLIELSVDWRDNKRIRSHRDQVEGNIRIKLKPREDREEPTELSIEKAMDGAARLALAMMMTRRLTIRHSVESDNGGNEAAFDPMLILPNWTVSERKALLERPLFGFASYGRVRFHHRSVMEFLASERLRSLRSKGMPTAALKRLIFVKTKGKTIVRHSKRAVAGWLALSESMIFETLRDNEPDVLLNEGDPESLTAQQRVQVLRAFVSRHSKGGWRGISVPNIQIHRFASPELSEEVKLLWSEGIENLEIRKILLQLIELGRMADCSDIAFNSASDVKAELGERLDAIDALASLNDPRLCELVNNITSNSPYFSEKLTRFVVMRLFPKHMSVAQLLEILPRLKSGEDRIGDLSWHLPRVISETVWKPEELEEIRSGLTKLISKDLSWEQGWPHFCSSYLHLDELLAATCLKSLEVEATSEVFHSCALALVLADRRDLGEKVFQKLIKILNELPAEQISKLFWATDKLMQSLDLKEDSWKRFVETTFHWRINLKYERDLNWMKLGLSATDRSEADRAMLLEGASRIGPNGDDWFEHMNELKPLVVDVPHLTLWIDDRVEKARQNSGPAEWEIKQEQRKKRIAQKEAQNLASWEKFWAEISKDPEKAFSDKEEENTAWNLWHAMSKAGSRGRESGWNRQFIEAYLGKDIADRLRLTLMRQWRDDRPTLTSERPDDAKGTYLVKWQLGLAGIYAESEDPGWATRLSSEEARLATRYAPMELNSLPSWMESLIEVHPTEVEVTLGSELIYELNGDVENHFHSMTLQEIGLAPSSVRALFLPRIKDWLDTKIGQLPLDSHEKGEIERLVQVTSFLAKYGDISIESRLCEIAREQFTGNPTGPLSQVWLNLLMSYDVKSGVDGLEQRIQSVTPSNRSEAVTLIGNLFGGRERGINFTASQFSAPILLRLMRLIYRHVRPEDDVHHDEAYTPDTLDNAEQTRSNIVNVLLAFKGDEGWAAKLEMAADPLCAHFKDRIIAMAEESWAEEVDGDAFSDKQAIALDQSGEAPPATNEAMFTLMVDRLEDIDDLLFRDVSPRESWSKNKAERIMRREIARELSHLANGLYTIDQEAVTADEKETDIRLRSTASEHEAIIELKLADGRPVQDLLDTLEKQLVTKYMASDISRSGCLLVTLTKSRKWVNPAGGSQIDFGELIKLLESEAERVVKKYGGVFRLHVHAFDLNPRLPTEAGNKN